MSFSVSKSSAALLYLSLFGAVLLTGCSEGLVPTSSQVTAEPDKSPIGVISGAVHGGQAPVTSANIYLFAAGTGGYGSAATSLITSSTCDSHGCYVQTDPLYGTFTLNGEYQCTAGQQVYMVAVGGDPGMGSTNSAIVQMAGLGQCPASGSMAQQVPYLVINEVTTTAFAYAMGAYGTDAFHVGSPNTALAKTGIADAMLNANNIVALAYGGALAAVGGNANSVAPQQKINTLADILATCVNSTGPSSSGCSALFKNATNSAGTQPTDEATAIFNILHNPTKNVTTIANLNPTAPVFSPYLAGPPTDWTLSVIYNNAVGQPSGAAIDASGNVWISDSTNKAVVMLSAQGALSSFTNGGSFGSMGGVAVNPVTGTIWASDSTNNKVYILDTTGSVLTTITTGTLNKPAGIAFDRLGNGYVVNSGAYVIDEYTSSGTLVQTSTYPSAQGYSTTIAVDYSGDVYTGAGAGKSGVGALLAGTTASQFFNHSDSAGPIALDATQNTALATTQYNTTQPNDIWSISSSTGLGWRYNFYTQGYTFGGVYNNTYIGQLGGMKPGTSPSSLAFDGAGNLWIAEGTPTANSTYPLTGFNVSSSYNLTAMATNGFTTGAASGVGAYMAVPDGAGNVWVLNKDGSVSQMIGLATPVVTPMVPGKFCTEP